MTDLATDPASESAADGAADPAADPGPGEWLALVLLTTAFFIDVMGSTTVFAAGPEMQRTLGLSETALQWTFTAATLPAGALLLAGGRLADLVGRRRCFLAGTAALAATSLACGSARSPAWLLAARALQGAAGAVLLPAALGLLMHLFATGKQRGRALAVWSAVGGVGATAGLLLGGVITETAGWRWIFWVNVPVCLVLLVATPLLVREPPPALDSRRLDLTGTLTSSLSVGCLVLALTRAPAVGWAGPATLLLAGAGVALGVVFVRVEARSTHPLVPLHLLRSPSVRHGNLVLLTAGLTVDGLLFTLTEYTQGPLGYSSARFGAVAAIMTVTSVAGAFAGERLAARVGVVRLALTGLGLLVGTACWLAVVGSAGWGLAALAAGNVVFGLAMGAAYLGGSVSSLEGVPDHDAGVASGVQSISFTLGSTLGVALVATTATAVRGAHGSASAASTWAFGASAVAALVGLVASAAAVRGGRARRDWEAPEAMS